MLVLAREGSAHRARAKGQTRQNIVGPGLLSGSVAPSSRMSSRAPVSAIRGMTLSGVAMAFAAFGWLSLVAGAVIQEGIDVAVILNALRALLPGRKWGQGAMPAATALALRHEHETLEVRFNRLREIADALDDADPRAAVTLIGEANRVVGEVVAHEQSDERMVYPELAKFLHDVHGLGAMSRAHREIMHLARLLDRLASDLTPEDANRYLIRDGQRVIEAIEALVRLHNAQEEDIYEDAATA